MNANEIARLWGFHKRAAEPLPDKIGSIAPDVFWDSVSYPRRKEILQRVKRAIIRWAKRWGSMYIVVLLLLCTGATALVIRGLSALREAAQVRARLDALRVASGLDQAVRVDFVPLQPNIAALNLKIDPVLVRSVAVTFDGGANWRTLYASRSREVRNEVVLTLEDQQRFTVPKGQKRVVSALVRVEYISEVLTAFPEYQEKSRTEYTASFEFTDEGIKQVATDAPAPSEIVPMGSVDLGVDRWEIVTSLDAVASASIDADDALVATFTFGNAHEKWISLSRSLPWATASVPAVSLDDLSMISVSLLWKGPKPIAVEPKLVDDHGRTIGIVRVVEASDKVQTLAVPLRSLKGYWDIRSFNLSSVRRIELAVAHKAPHQATEGTLRIKSIELLGWAKPPPLPTVPMHLKTLATLPMKPDAWNPARSDRATIELSPEAEGLACKVALSWDASTGEALPWTNLETKQLPDRGFTNLQAIEIELRWDGTLPVTLEPKLVTSDRGVTYGLQRLIKPTAEFRKIRVLPQDLKYYWSKGGVTDATRMDLSQLTAFSLGIARKSPSQADGGTLHIRSIAFLVAAVEPSDAK